MLLEKISAGREFLFDESVCLLLLFGSLGRVIHVFECGFLLG